MTILVRKMGIWIFLKRQRERKEVILLLCERRMLFVDSPVMCYQIEKWIYLYKRTPDGTGSWESIYIHTYTYICRWFSGSRSITCHLVENTFTRIHPPKERLCVPYSLHFIHSEKRMLSQRLWVRKMILGRGKIYYFFYYYIFFLAYINNPTQTSYPGINFPTYDQNLFFFL